MLTEINEQINLGDFDIKNLKSEMDVVDLIIEFNNLIVEGKYELENDEIWDDVGEIFPISNGEVGFTWCCSRELDKKVMLFMSLKRKIT